MRIDAHQHFWRYRSEDYPWMSADMTVLRRDWLPEDLAPLLGGHGLDASVVVQARANEAETDFLLSLAERHEWIAGVVGWTDLRAGDLERRLERRAEAAKLAGFRHQVQDEPDAAAFLADSRFRRGVQALQSRSLVYEVLVFASQLAAVPDFCAACDRHWIVLDHLGKPAIADGGFEVWRKQVTPLRGMPRVQCKLSGLVTEAMNDEGELDPGDLRRYFDAALEIFGPERLMFGSDWPVCLLAADYAEVVDLVTQWAAALSAGERDAIWGETAVRTYALTGES